MIINILVGVAFFMIMAWLLRGALHNPPAPGELIRRKEETRRLEQGKVNAALARVGAFSQIRLDDLFAAARDMHNASSSGEAFEISRTPEAVELAFRQHSLRITHHVRQVDLDRDNLSDNRLMHLERFRLEMPRRAPEDFTELETLLEHLADLIVDFSNAPED